MSLVRLYNVEKRFDDTLVLREVFFRLEAGERVGLIGRNGTGKTTLLRLILGQEEPTAGAVDIAPGVRIGYFSQFSELDGDRTIVEELDALFDEIHAIEEALLEIEIAIEDGATGKALDELLRRQADLIEEMNRRDGWNYRNRIDTVLTRLGFSEEHRTLPIGQLSGGWRNRAALAKLLLEEPDVLLLDEPTNYLDIEGLAWLEAWLKGYRGAALIVSHDRDFIDHVVDRIVEIENYHLHEYPGDFTQYVRLRKLRLKSLERQFQHEEELLVLEAEAISDRQEARRDPQRALRRRLANIKKRREPRPVDRIITRLYDGLRVPRALCRVENLTKGYGDVPLLADLCFEIQRGDRIAVVGPNGCGKTTLLRMLNLDEPPDGGEVRWYKGADWVNYNDVFAELDPKDTVSHAVNIVGMAYRAPRKQVNHFLSLLGFSELELKQRIGTLSGGQKARVALAQCLLSGAGAILLDEPTNHLDLPSIQVMERALLHFPGAIVVATHDRFFIDKVANRLLIFEGQGRVREVTGNWTLWEASRCPTEEIPEPAQGSRGN